MPTASKKISPLHPTERIGQACTSIGRAPGSEKAHAAAGRKLQCPMVAGAV